MAETILIVDDDPVQRRLLEGMATRFGYDVICAEGGDVAVAALTAQDTRIDCVVLDLVMPDLDGYGVLARMRDAGVNVPVIVQTAHGGIDKVVSAIKKDYSTKTIFVDGHTDADPITRTKEQWEDNWDLAAARANAVRRYLTSHGVDPHKVDLRSFGPNHPKKSKDASRRVEIVVQVS